MNLSHSMLLSIPTEKACPRASKRATRSRVRDRIFHLSAINTEIVRGANVDSIHTRHLVLVALGPRRGIRPNAGAHRLGVAQRIDGSDTLIVWLFQSH